MSAPSAIDLDRLLKLRLAIGRLGEGDRAAWWNTRGQLGTTGGMAVSRGFPRTHHFAQARAVFAVADARSAEVFEPTGCVTLWRLDARTEESFDRRWERWLDHAPDWAPFFNAVARITGTDVVATLRDLALVDDADLGAIQHLTAGIESEYEQRHALALQARVTAYEAALVTLQAVAGWRALDQAVRDRIAAPFERLSRSDSDANTPIPQLASDRDAAEGRLRAAVAEVLRLIEGERLVALSLSSYFGGGVETTDQLDAALEGIREECTRLIGAGKKVVIQ